MMRDIKGYEGLYSVTSCGKVWSRRRKRFLTSFPVNGYLMVNLCKDGVNKNHLLHRLVAQAYIPNPNNLETVDHKNRNKTQNYVNNLQWMTRYDNLIKDCPEFKRQRVLCVETGQVFESQIECALALGIDQGGVGQVLRGRLKSFKGYHFKHTDQVNNECETHLPDVREMLRNACMYHKGQDISKLIKRSTGGYVYSYNGVGYDLRKCKDVCDLYEELSGIRPLAIKCADGKYIIYADHYRAYVRQQTIDLCEQSLSEV